MRACTEAGLRSAQGSLQQQAIDGSVRSRARSHANPQGRAAAIRAASGLRRVTPEAASTCARTEHAALSVYILKQGSGHNKPTPVRLTGFRTHLARKSFEIARTSCVQQTRGARRSGTTRQALPDMLMHVPVSI